MAKKRRSKPKPLLSVQGILHLQNSFVQPTDESGLLSTVGGKTETPLVLAPNYGYGIPASTLKFKDQNKDQNEGEVQEKNEKQIQNEKNSSSSPAVESPEVITISDSEDKEPDNNNSKSGDDDEEEKGLSVAQLVRNIGGAKNRPLYQKDVVEDRDLPPEENTDKEKEEEPLDEETQAKTDEFYASIGLANPNEKKQAETEEITPAPAPNQNSSDSSPKASNDAVVPMVIDNQDSSSSDFPVNQTTSIAEYYKTYCQYYYSQDPDPLSDKPLEFNKTIDPNDTSSNLDESMFELARRAQKARRAMDAAITAKREETLRAQREAQNKILRDNDAYDPLPMEIVQDEYEVVNVNIDTTTTLNQYWDYVKENPHDFNRWTYLIHYAESTNNLPECRKVYSAFLPLFPYCFGYWKRYAEIEKAHHYFYRSLSILSRGIEFTPLSVDLRLSYLNLFHEVHAHESNVEDLLREEFNKGLKTLGLEFKSDAFWEAYIQWETMQSNLKNVFRIYRKLIQVPTRIYNRHCDNVKVIVRDHHPRDFLPRIEYEKMRKRGCKLLKLKYKEEPELEAGEIRKPSKPEDKLMAHVKEILLEKIEACHKKNEIEVDKRWDYEEKIKRPYFHVKALDRKQLKNWADYLSFEMKEGNHDRIVLLFERCITSCAHYESYWCKYARYLENYHKKNTKEISVHFQKSQINIELVSTKETEEEEARVNAAVSVIESLISEVERLDHNEFCHDIQLVLNSVLSQIMEENHHQSPVSPENELFPATILEKVDFLSPTNRDDKHRESSEMSSNLDGNSSSVDELPPKSGKDKTNENDSSTPGFNSLLSVPTFPPTIFRWQEVVRDIYKRGSVIHCPKKPIIRLQWAAYEEELGNVTEAKQLIQHVIEWFPELIEAKLQLLEFERRNGSHDAVLKLYDEYLKNCKSKATFSVISLKYAKFLFKELGKADKALLALRKAVLKDKGNVLLYNAIFSLCYERYPTDKKGALASLELAIQNKLLTPEEKLQFHKKKLLFLQEHGDLPKYRNAIDAFNDCKEIVDLAREEEEKLKAYDVPNIKDVERPAVNLLQPFPVPSWPAEGSKKAPQQPTPIRFDQNGEAVPPAPPQTSQQKEEEEDDEAYKSVPPTKELLVGSDYGYSYKHPEQRLIDNYQQKEYEKLEVKGYPEHLKNKEGDNSGSRKRKPETPMYIVAPKGSYLMSYLGGPNTADNPPVPGGAVYLEGAGNKRMKLEAPVEMTSLLLPTNAPCINVPDWFVKEGGELCISETTRGFSVLRYWPHFLTEAGNKKMFKSIRKNVKWHQKQILVGPSDKQYWKHIPRLISWLGPCEYSHNGMSIEKNEDWPPEVLDLLHRLIKMTHHQFNSCSLNLYRTGHDSNAWHSDLHKALGSNPPVASVSLGCLRYFELRKKGYEQNFLRFPLFPGSLLLMEGATQEDWVHQVPKDPTIKEERVNLTFRVMHAIDVPGAPVPSKDKESETATSATKTDTEKPEKEKETTKNPEPPPKATVTTNGEESPKVIKSTVTVVPKTTSKNDRKARSPTPKESSSKSPKSSSKSIKSTIPRISFRKPVVMD